MADRLPAGEFNGADEPDLRARWIENQERIQESLGLSIEEYGQQIIDRIQEVTGPLSDWQHFWVFAIILGRRVEWAQTPRGPHYHIVGLPCAICGRR